MEKANNEAIILGESSFQELHGCDANPRKKESSYVIQHTFAKTRGIPKFIPNVTLLTHKSNTSIYVIPQKCMAHKDIPRPEIIVKLPTVIISKIDTCPEAWQFSIPGKIDWVPCEVAINSRCTYSSIDVDFAKKAGLQLEPLIAQVKVSKADRTPHGDGWLKHKTAAILEMDKKDIPITLLLAALRKDWVFLRHN